MISLLKKQRPSSILGLAFDGNNLEILSLRRSNGHFQILRSQTVTLALSPLNGEPELVGREIRNHLDQAGIRERKCVVCLPINWGLTLSTPLPDLPEGDLQSFLQIEAERGFPSGLETLSIRSSRAVAASGEKHVLQMAVPMAHIASLEAVLKCAKLRPESFSFGAASLQSADGESGVLSVVLNSDGVDLQVTCGGGIVALRYLDGLVDSEGTQKRIDAEIIAREIRITLGQLPPAFQTAVKTFRVFGRGDLARRFFSDITHRVEAMGLTPELVERCSGQRFPNVIPVEASISPALSMAVHFLEGTPQPLEYLPPRVSTWQQLVSSRYSSKKLAWAAGIAGGLILITLLAFGIQQIRIVTLESRWKAMEPKVTELKDMQAQIKKFRPWFDESFKTLSILKKLTEAFPEDGNVSAKTLEFREPATITCTAVARDTQAYIKLLDKLRATKGIGSVSVEDVHGQSPVQFTFNFQWEGESGHGN